MVASHRISAGLKYEIRQTISGQPKILAKKNSTDQIMIDDIDDIEELRKALDIMESKLRK